MSNLIVFDIETIPDTANGRLLNDWPQLNEADTASAMTQLRRQDRGSEFLPHYLQKIVAISVVFSATKRDQQQTLQVYSLGTPESTEKELIERFFTGIATYQPVLVSWNGGGFDLPVLHYRSLLHGVAAPLYWENGERDREAKYANYLSRYHYRHMDLMDILSGYQLRAAAPLDNIAKMLGFPGKMGKSGASVWQQYQAGELIDIRRYCETDVLNTYLIYLKFEYIRGRLTEQQYQAQSTLLADYLAHQQQPHFEAFLQAWQR